jgi:hypothetical protein
MDAAGAIVRAHAEDFASMPRNSAQELLQGVVSCCHHLLPLVAICLAELPKQDDDGFYGNKGLTKLGPLLKVFTVANYSGQSMRHISISPGGVSHIAIGSFGGGCFSPNLAYIAFIIASVRRSLTGSYDRASFIRNFRNLK